MLFAGAIELSTGEIALIIGILAAMALAVCAVGAVTAWAIARRPAAVPLGAVALVVVMVAVGDVTHAPHIGFLAGWAASAAVGFLLPPRPRHPAGRGQS